MYDVNVILKAQEALDKARVPMEDRDVLMPDGEVIHVLYTPKVKATDIDLVSGGSANTKARSKLAKTKLTKKGIEV